MQQGENMRFVLFDRQSCVLPLFALAAPSRKKPPRPEQGELPYGLGDLYHFPRKSLAKFDRKPCSGDGGR
jgi:hypothetical protein